MVGGVLWGHPGSDMLPILTVAEAVLIVENGDGHRQVSVGPGVNRKLKHGDLVVGVFIPNNTVDDIIVFCKQARRKTVELAVINMALYTNFTNNIKMTIIVIGGIDLAVKQCTLQDSSRAFNLEKLFTSKKSGFADNSAALLEAIKTDLGSKADQYKIGIIAEMLNDVMVTKKTVLNKPSAHQLFEKVNTSQSPVDPITRPIAHLSAAEQCTGEAQFTDDIPNFVGELKLVPMHSTMANAKIVKLCRKDAMLVPGVVAWISAEDIPGLNMYANAGPPDTPILPKEDVNFHGMIIGAIAAETIEAGKEAVKLVKITYKSNPVLLTIAEAVEKDICIGDKSFIERNQDETLLKSATHSFDGKIKLGGQFHIYMEPQSAIAVPGTEKNELIIYAATQNATGVQKAIASALSIPMNKVIVKIRRLGGAFGGKEGALPSLIAAVAAKKLMRPCRMIFERTSDLIAMGHRHEVHAGYNVNFNDSGKITSAKIECDVNAGSFRDVSVVWSMFLAMRLDAGYTIKNFNVLANPRKTDLKSNTAFRGFGGPEGTCVMEECIERIAHLTGKDPALVRRENLTREGDLLHQGEGIICDDNLLKCWEQCLDQSNYFEMRKEVENFNNDPANKKIKRGISIIPCKFTPFIPAKFRSQGSAYVRIYIDGSILVSHGGVEVGQGLHTKMLQVASTILRVPIEKIHLVETSTETNVNATTTGNRNILDFQIFNL